MKPSDTDESGPDAPVWPRPAVSAAVFRSGLVLLAQRSKPPLRGLWSLPGGRIEPGEKAEAAAARELAEETGIQAEFRGIADVKDVILRDGEGALRGHYVITVFYGAWARGEARAGSDCMDVEWVEPSALSGRPMTEGTAAIIERAASLIADR